MVIDTGAIKQRTDLLGLIGADTRLKKVAATGGGELWATDDLAEAAPSPHAGGIDAHASDRIGRGLELAGADQGVHARAIELEPSGGLGHREPAVLFNAVFEISQGCRRPS